MSTVNGNVTDPAYCDNRLNNRTQMLFFLES